MTPSADGAEVDLNRWLDHVPRLTIDVGHRRLPVFRSLGVVGFELALVVAVLVSLLVGLPLATALGLSGVAGLSFFAWGLLRRAVTGQESYALFEHVGIAFAAVAGFLWASGGPVVAGLDVLAVSLCVFLAFGRLGCAAAGCCHGVLSEVGIAYGPEHGLPARLTGRRLLPVQLLEAAGLAGIGVVGGGLATGQPGRATVWFLAAYAVLRFGCEALRGDARPSLLGLSLPRLLCVAQLAAAIVASEAWLVPGPPGRALVAAALVLAVVAAAGFAVTRSRARNPLVAADHLDELWLLVTSLLPRADPVEPIVARTSLGMAVAVTRDGPLAHVSLSHPEHATLPVALALHPDDLIERRDVTHLLLDGSSLPAPGNGGGSPAGGGSVPAHPPARVAGGLDGSGVKPAVPDGWGVEPAVPDGWGVEPAVPDGWGVEPAVPAGYFGRPGADPSGAAPARSTAR